jgi:peptidoglycan/xylan/chitin deacetylase (PgdA/CDA1 family)
MKRSLTALSLSAMALLAGCGTLERTSAQKPNLADCATKLEAVIPEVAQALRQYDKEDNGARPLDGMEVALTINDLSLGEVGKLEEDYIEGATKDQKYFDKLLEALEQNHMPPTLGFVVGKYFDAKLQQEWLRRGNLMGNMTYSFKILRRTTPQEFMRDVEMNDRLLAPLWQRYQPRRKYFRYPRFRMEAPQRDQIQAELKRAGYLQVPATIDPRDDQFNNVYRGALEAGDQSCAKLLKVYFRTLLLGRSLKARQAAKRLVGRDIKHILVLRANRFTCENLAEILAWYKQLGVKFITIDEALTDPIYSSARAPLQIMSEARDFQQ